MVYASVDGLVRRYSLKTIQALASTGKELDEQKVQEALSDASQTIDSYLVGRYSLPLSSVPSVLERHCCYIARYFLEKNRPTDQARIDYEDSLKFLEKVSTGLISLGLTDGGDMAESESIIVIQSEGTVWGRSKSKGFI